jgi:2-dehydro-3-deoxyphosphogluconate aldolase / (4S)-4-hydroxy-2-oxoglutarate aldolase
MSADIAEVDERLAAARLLPVLVLDDPDTAVGLAEALLAGGLDLAEVTFRTAAAEAALRAMATVSGMCVGAGTVLTADQVDRAVDAGARFVVSPGLNPDVVRRCADLTVPVFPGVATATELMSAIRLGVRTVKLFPAKPLGGPGAVSALAGPFPGIRFIPTGGVDASTVAAYLGHPAVLAVGGSWMAPAALVRAGDWHRIAELTAGAVSAAHDVEVSR